VDQHPEPSHPPLLAVDADIAAGPERDPAAIIQLDRPRFEGVNDVLLYNPYHSSVLLHALMLESWYVSS
jgi:hypothetical protein